MSNAKKIRRYLAKFPNASAREVADKFGTSVAYVYTLRSHMKREAVNTAIEEGEKGDWVVMYTATSDKSVKELDNKVTPTATDVDATLAERGNRYGPFRGHAEVTIGLKKFISAALFLREKKLDPDQQEALDMICHKIGRIVNGDPNYADSWIDIAGYAKLVADRLETGKEV
jgi:hypothetical protein